MNAIRIRRQVDSDLLHVPELKGMLGKTVEIIILEETPMLGPSHEVPPCFHSLAPKEAFDPRRLRQWGGT